MKILGIHDGHNASACLTIDGNLKVAIGEERLTRNKHQYGFPFNAIDKIFEITNITRQDIDIISMSTKSLPPRYFLTQRNSNFTIKDYWKEQKEYWYPFNRRQKVYTEIFKHHPDENKFPYDSSLIKNENDHEDVASKKKTCSNYLNIKEDKISI